MLRSTVRASENGYIRHRALCFPLISHFSFLVSHFSLVAIILSGVIDGSMAQSPPRSGARDTTFDQESMELRIPLDPSRRDWSLGHVRGHDVFADSLFPYSLMLCPDALMP